MKRAIVLGALVAVGSLSLAAYQPPQQQGPKVVEVDKVKDNLWVLKGGGGNTAVFATANGVVVVDAKNPGWGQPILDKIKELTPKPVSMLINTHTHADHVSGNVEFPATIDIVTQENTKANMEKMDIFKQNNGKGMPKRTFKDKMTLGKGRDEIDLHYFGRGHTNGDTWVVFPALRVMHTGDMFAWKDAPTLDRNNGGSGLEYAATVGKALATVKNVDTLIVGHSPLRTVPELREYQQFMTDFANAVKQAKAAGKSVDDAAASIDLTPKYKGYTKDRYKAAVQAIYDELK